MKGTIKLVNVSHLIKWLKLKMNYESVELNKLNSKILYVDITYRFSLYNELDKLISGTGYGVFKAQMQYKNNLGIPEYIDNYVYLKELNEDIFTDE